MIKDDLVDVDKLREVLIFLSNAPNLRVKQHDIQSEEDSTIDDILHMIELDTLSAKEKRIAVDKLKESRERRRHAKDLNAQLDIIINFLDEIKYSSKSADRVIGRLVHKQRTMSEREYTPKTDITLEE